jgi:hypothetical protein
MVYKNYNHQLMLGCNPSIQSQQLHISSRKDAFVIWTKTNNNPFISQLQQVAMGWEGIFKMEDITCPGGPSFGQQVRRFLVVDVRLWHMVQWEVFAGSQVPPIRGGKSRIERACNSRGTAVCSALNFV